MGGPVDYAATKAINIRIHQRFRDNQFKAL